MWRCGLVQPFNHHLVQKRCVLKGLDFKTSPRDPVVFQHQAVWIWPLETSGLEHFAFDRDSALPTKRCWLKMPSTGHEAISVGFFLVCWGKIGGSVTKEDQQKKYLNNGPISTLATRCTWLIGLKGIDSLRNNNRTPKGSKRIFRSCSKGSKDNSWQNDEWWLEDALCIDVMSFGMLWARQAWHFMLEWTLSLACFSYVRLHACTPPET